MLFKNRKVKIVSLGQNCIPRTILTRNGLKPSKWQGEPTYPFDLAVFSVHEVTKSIKFDFAEFFNDLVYKKSEDGKTSYWVKTPNCIEFIHGNNLNEMDKNQLIKIYTKRIKNFRKMMFSYKPVLFVQIINEYEDIYNLYAELLKKRMDRPFKLAIIDVNDVVKEIRIKDVEVLKLPFPSEEYKNNWWKKEYYDSIEGQVFERQFCDFCQMMIDKLIYESK